MSADAADAADAAAERRLNHSIPRTYFVRGIQLGSYYLLQFGLINPYLAPKYHFGPYLALLTYIYHYLPIFGLNYPYLGIFPLNCPDFTICAIFTLYMYSSIETAPLCKILEQSDHYLWR